MFFYAKMIKTKKNPQFFTLGAIGMQNSNSLEGGGRGGGGGGNHYITAQ